MEQAGFGFCPHFQVNISEITQRSFCVPAKSLKCQIVYFIQTIGHAEEKKACHL